MVIRRLILAGFIGLISLSLGACMNRASRLTTGGQSTTPSFSFTPTQPIQTTSPTGLTCSVAAPAIPQDFQGVARMQNPSTGEFMNGLVIKFTVSTNVQGAIVTGVESMPAGQAFSQSSDFRNVFLKHQLESSDTKKFRVVYRVQRSASSSESVVCSPPEIDYRALYAQLKQTYGNQFPDLDNPGGTTTTPPVFTPQQWPPFNPAQSFNLEGVPVKLKITGPDTVLTLTCNSLEISLRDVNDGYANARGDVSIPLSEITPQGQEINNLSFFVKTSAACDQIVAGNGSQASNEILTGDLVIPNGTSKKSVFYVAINGERDATILAKHRNGTLQEARKTIRVENNQAHSRHIHVQGEDCPGVCDNDYNDLDLDIYGLIAATNKPGVGTVFQVLRNETLSFTGADTRSTSGCTHAIWIEKWEYALNTTSGQATWTYAGIVFNVADDHVPNPGSANIAFRQGDQFRVLWRTTKPDVNGCGQTTGTQTMDSPYSRLSYDRLDIGVEGSWAQHGGNLLN